MVRTLDDLMLTTRLRNCLLNHFSGEDGRSPSPDEITFEMIRSLDPEELVRALPNFGPKCADDLRYAISEEERLLGNG